MVDTRAAGDSTWSARALAALDRSQVSAAVLIDGSWRVRWASGSWSRIFGDSPLGRCAVDLIHPGDIDYIQAVGLETEQGPLPGSDLRIRHADGSWLTCRAEIANHLDCPEVGALMVNVELSTGPSELPDAIDLVAGGAPTEDVLMAALRLMSTDTVRFSRSAMAVAWTDGEGRRHVATTASTEISPTLFSAEISTTRWDPGRVTAIRVTDLEPGPARRLAGTLGFTCLWKIATGEDDGHVDHVLFWSGDMITPDLRPRSPFALGCGVIRLALRERRRSEEMHFNAITDPLTGVYNRRGLHEAFATLSSSTPTVAALFIEIDRFKSLVDTWGPSVGDQVLTEVAARLDGVCRSGDIVARMGNDEFVILCTNVEPDALSSILRRVETVFTAPVHTEAGPVDVSGRIGFSSASRGPGPADQLRDTDQALYAMKRRARAGVVAGA